MERPTHNLETLKAEIAANLPVLSVMNTQLRQTAAQIETSVVEVCGSFQQMAERTRAGAFRATEFLSGNSGLSTGNSIEGLIERARLTIERLLKRTQDATAVAQSAVVRIQRVSEATNQISKSLAQLDDIAIGSKLLAVNARIQAVYAGEKGAGFGGVANEIAAQAQRSTQIVDSIRTVSQELNVVAQAAVVDLERMAAEDLRACERSKAEVECALGDFRYMHSSMQQLVNEMTQESATVAVEISSAVRSLQFQDRVSQRISHVIEQIEAVERRLGICCDGISIDASAILQQLSQRYTMSEERHVLGTGESHLEAGDVEIF